MRLSQAGVRRTVHFSVANASADSALPYFRGKGQVEEILQDMGIPYAIIRPTLVFGEGDLLLKQHGLGATALPGVSRVWQRRLSGPACIRGGSGCAVSPRRVPGMGTLLPMLPGRRLSVSRNCSSSWPRRWALASGWCIRRLRWAGYNSAGRPAAAGRGALPRRS